MPRVAVRATIIIAGVTTNHVAIEIRENSAVCLVAKPSISSAAKVHPQQVSAEQFAIDRDPARTLIQTASLGSKVKRNDCNGGDGYVKIQGGRQAAVVRNYQAQHNAQGVGQSIPQSLERQVLVNLLPIRHGRQCFCLGAVIFVNNQQ